MRPVRQGWQYAWHYALRMDPPKPSYYVLNEAAPIRTLLGFTAGLLIRVALLTIRREFPQ